MPRPTRCRRIGEYPSFWSFVPEGVEPTATIDFMLDELETIRMIDFQGKTQEECAAVMGVSRVTVTGIYERARGKMADAMLNGKRLRITGGSYKMDDIPATEELKRKGDKTMRIAVTYENGMVGQHFGRTTEFKIYETEGDKIIASQVIDTNGVGHCALSGFLRAAEVEVLICGGIGMGARNALAEVGVKLLPGAAGEADAVVASYLAGKLDYDPDTVCAHHEHEHGEGHECHHGEEGHECHHGEGGCGHHGCH